MSINVLKEDKAIQLPESLARALKLQILVIWTSSPPLVELRVATTSLRTALSIAKLSSVC